jgi:hypothetical protein
MRPIVYLQKRAVQASEDTIVTVAVSYSPQTYKLPGKFDAEIEAMLREILAADSTRILTEPDSSNTRIFWLDAWPVSDETVLVETYAGEPAGSCGATIKVCRYSQSTDHWMVLRNECGTVDTVLSISHNGLFDFVIRDKWDMDHWAFRFDGVHIVETELQMPQSDFFNVQRVICEKEGLGPINLDLRLSYLNLGDDSIPFIIAEEGFAGKYFFTRNKYGQAELLFGLPDAAQIDFLETQHQGMPDFRTFDVTYKYGFYEWNGRVYQRTRDEEWSCPL